MGKPTSEDSRSETAAFCEGSGPPCRFRQGGVIIQPRSVERTSAAVGDRGIWGDKVDVTCTLGA